MTTTEFGALGEPIERTQIRVRKAARCLPRHGLGHAYGHVSARLDDASFLVCAAKPMGLISVGDFSRTCCPSIAHHKCFS